MVHRIQNRNAGYSDFTQTHVSSSLNNSVSSALIDGANALKIDNEITQEAETDSVSSNVSEDQSKAIQEVVLENKEENNHTLILENEYQEEEKASNGLENFQIEDDTPELFDSENTLETEKNENEQEFSSFSKEQNEEEDELEIPAFLRRQKN